MGVLAALKVLPGTSVWYLAFPVKEADFRPSEKWKYLCSYFDLLWHNIWSITSSEVLKWTVGSQLKIEMPGFTSGGP